MTRTITALSTAVVLVVASLTHGPSKAQPSYPTQTIKFVVPYPAGGLPDTVARVFARKLQERLVQPAVVENRPGANGGIAAAALATSPPDGYTLMVTDGTILTINPALYATLPYNPHDIAPVALLARAPLFLAVHPKLGVGSMSELITHAQAHPGKLNYGSSGIGSVHQLSMEAIKASLHLDISHVPYKGVGESVPALLGGHIDAVFAAYPSLGGAAAEGRVKLLAVNSGQRSAQAPALPALSEFIPGFDFAPMIGIFARAGTPLPILRRIADEAMAVASNAEVAERLAIIGVETAGAGPEEFKRALENESARVAVAVKAAGLTPQ
jgi:tripartite-type tricarboxylate transporter receptor subunit TctC